MKCKGCGREISRVRVYSECWQYGFLEGKKLIEYGSIEGMSDFSSGVECPECHEDLMDDVEL